MTVAVKTTTVRYNRPAKAAVMYDIVPLEVDLSYDPNSGTNFSGGARWQVYKIEGSVRSKMRNELDGYVCYCGFSDDTTFEAGVADNDSFDDDSSISGTAYNGQSMFTVRWGQLTGGVFVQLARKDFPVTIIGKNGDDAVTLDWDNEFETMQWVANEGSAGAWKNQPVSNLYIYRGEEDITKDCTVTYTLNGVTAKYKARSGTRWYRLASGATIKGKISVLVTAINAYFKALEGDVLDKTADNACRVSLSGQRGWLESHGTDTGEMSDAEILRANTGSEVFLEASLTFCDAMEDLTLRIAM